MRVEQRERRSYGQVGKPIGQDIAAYREHKSLSFRPIIAPVLDLFRSPKDSKVAVLTTPEGFRLPVLQRSSDPGAPAGGNRTVEVPPLPLPDYAQMIKPELDKYIEASANFDKAVSARDNSKFKPAKTALISLAASLGTYATIGGYIGAALGVGSG